jgi:hypothetical protein
MAKAGKVDRSGMLIGPITFLAAGALFGGLLISEAQKLANSPSSYSRHAMDSEGGNVLAVALQSLMRVYVGAVGVTISRVSAIVLALAAIALFVRGIQKYRAQVAADRGATGTAEQAAR